MVDISDPNGNIRVKIKVVKMKKMFSLKKMSGQLEAAAAACLTSPPQVAVFRHRWHLLDFYFWRKKKFQKVPPQFAVFRPKWHFLDFSPRCVFSTILRREKEISMRDIFTCLSISFQAASEGLCSALLTLALLALSVRWAYQRIINLELKFLLLSKHHWLI